MDTAPPDRLRELLDTVLAALDEHLDGGRLAGRAYLSRFHFDRLVAAGLGEPPAAFRRRLLLERAAWRLAGGAAGRRGGGAAAHVITFSAYRRQVLIEALAELGVTGIEPCPMEWERARQASRPHAADELRGA